MSGRKVLREKVNGLLIPEDEVIAQCNAYRGALSNHTQSIATGPLFKKVTAFTTSSVNIGVNLDFVNNEIEVLSGGTYDVSYSIVFSTDSTSKNVDAGVVIDSTAIRQIASSMTTANNTVAMSGRALIDITAGQRVSIGIAHSLPGSSVFTFYHISLSLVKIGG